MQFSSEWRVNLSLVQSSWVVWGYMGLPRRTKYSLVCPCCRERPPSPTSPASGSVTVISPPKKLCFHTHPVTIQLNTIMHHIAGGGGQWLHITGSGGSSQSWLGVPCQLSFKRQCCVLQLPPLHQQHRSHEGSYTFMVSTEVRFVWFWPISDKVPN